MPTINEQRGPSSPAPMRRRRRHPVRNTLIVLVLLIVGSCIFLFGINKWRIDFRLIGDSTVVSECGTPYKDDGAEAEVTGSVLSLKFILKNVLPAEMCDFSAGSKFSV